jgi:Flp pilus assembly pilin Flp
MVRPLGMEVSMQMLTRFIQDESRTTFVEYALVAVLVAAIVALRVTMQA